MAASVRGVTKGGWEAPRNWQFGGWGQFPIAGEWGRSWWGSGGGGVRCSLRARLGRARFKNFLEGNFWRSLAARLARARRLQPTPPPTHCPQLRSRSIASGVWYPGVGKIARLDVLVLAPPSSLVTLPHSGGEWSRFPARREWGRRCGEGGCAWRWLNRSATEWSGGEEEASRAAAMHIRATNFADEQARGFRRANADNCRPAIVEARAPLREQSGSTTARRNRAPLHLYPRLLGNEECPHYA